jgi:hypothetical protein
MTVDALIDTGSPYTCLSTKDLMNSRVPYTKMRGETVYLAGQKFINIQIMDVSLIFRTDTDELFKVHLEALGGLVPTKRTDEVMQEVMHIPSIVGNDFLEDHGLVLFYDPKREIAYLETGSS